MIVPHTTIIKNINYSDTVLNLKELGENIKLTTISNVTEFYLEECLKTIFESNKDVNFNTIQYSKTNQRVCIYADKTINLAVYNEKQKSEHKYITKSSEILKEIRNVLTKEKCNDLEKVSLYTISKIVNEKMCEYEKTKHAFDQNLDYIIKSKYGSGSYITIFDFDYTNKNLRLLFNSHVNFGREDDKTFVFSKEDGDLYLSYGKDEGHEIFYLVGNHLSKLYDEFMKHKDFMTQSIFKITSDSKFLINVTKYGIDVCVPSQNNQFKYDFELSLSSYSKKYNCYCNSNNIISSIKGKEDEVFKRIFVKIEDCPENLRQTLYEMRSKELMEKDFVTSLKEKGIKLTKKITSLIKNKTK